MNLVSPDGRTENLLSESFVLRVRGLRNRFRKSVRRMTTFVFGRSSEKEFEIKGLPDWVSRRAIEVSLQKTARSDQLTVQNIGKALILVRLHMNQGDKCVGAGIKHYILIGDQVDINPVSDIDENYLDKIGKDSCPYIVVKKVESVLKVPLEDTQWTSMIEVIVLRTDQQVNNIRDLYQEKFGYVSRNEHVVFRFRMDSNEQWSLVEVSLDHYRK